MKRSQCAECGCVTLPPKKGQIALRGQRHYSTCPTLPHLTNEQAAALQADLERIAETRRKGEAAARNIVIY